MTAESPLALEDTCHACFSGIYPTGDIGREELDALEREREEVRGGQGS